MAEVAKAQSGKKLEVWFQDEMRLGQRGTLRRVWGEKGSRPIVPRQQDFEWAYTFGAVCPREGKSAGWVLPDANTEAMSLHLKEISQQVAKDAHGVVVVDRAGWHRTKSLEIPSNLTTLFLPAYSPELNPIELLWDWMRRNHLSNRIYEGYDEIVEASCQSWLAVISDKERLRSMCWFHWIKEAETN